MVNVIKKTLAAFFSINVIYIMIYYHLKVWGLYDILYVFEYLC